MYKVIGGSIPLCLHMNKQNKMADVLKVNSGFHMWVNDRS